MLIKGGVIHLNKRTRSSRNITLNKESIVIYDKWKDNGEAHKVSQAIIEFDGKSDKIIERVEELERKVKELEGKI